MSFSNSSVRLPLPKWVVIDKVRGQTPLEAIVEWKQSQTISVAEELATTPLSYAGRLDPMAEGKLLVLIGEECKRQSVYTKLDKEYEIEILLDLKTDTGDVLGIAEYAGKETTKLDTLPAILKQEIGARSRKYPVFSSKTVNGKPLFLYALDGKLGDITIPEHIEKIYHIQLEGITQISQNELRHLVAEHLSNVSRTSEPSKELGADFRQDVVKARWDVIFNSIPDRTFTTLTLRVTCGSGAYMRTLSERIGSSLGTTALALSINRRKIGVFRKWGPVGWWLRLYR